MVMLDRVVIERLFVDIFIYNLYKAFEIETLWMLAILK
jgi:hypothetical protein